MMFIAMIMIIIPSENGDFILSYLVLSRGEVWVFFRRNNSVIFAETCWSLKHFGHLSHSDRCIKNHHNSVF